MNDDRDYAHMRDPEAQRTRRELWAIVIIVVVVIVGALIWRGVEHKPAGPQKGYTPGGPGDPISASSVAVPAAAGVHPTMTPRPAGP